jgi:hypothetical protein
MVLLFAAADFSGAPLDVAAAVRCCGPKENRGWVFSQKR